MLYNLPKQYLFIYFLFLPSVIFSQGRSISGYVNGTYDSAVTGAAIILKGTTPGTVTDKNGFYRINKIKPATYSIRVSLIGYETLEKSIEIREGNNFADFSIRKSEINLNEVVVTRHKVRKNIK